MSEMNERISRVIFEKTRPSAAPLSVGELAQSIIEAMREPTEAMIDAGASVCSQGEGDTGTDTATRCYNYMLDAALK